MKTVNYKELSIEELSKKSTELKKELFNLKFQNNLGQLTNTSLISKVKKDIARINTFLTLKEKNQ